MAENYSINSTNDTSTNSNPRITAMYDTCSSRRNWLKWARRSAINEKNSPMRAKDAFIFTGVIFTDKKLKYKKVLLQKNALPLILSAHLPKFLKYMICRSRFKAAFLVRNFPKTFFWSLVYNTH